MNTRKFSGTGREWTHLAWTCVCGLWVCVWVGNGYESLEVPNPFYVRRKDTIIVNLLSSVWIFSLLLQKLVLRERYLC